MVVSLSRWSFVSHNRKTIAVIGGTVLAAVLCATTVLGCAALLADGDTAVGLDVSVDAAGFGISTAFGAGSSLASYGVSSKKKSRGGWIEAGLDGAAVGMAGGTADALITGTISEGGSVAARFAGQYLARSATSDVLNGVQDPEENAGAAVEGVQEAGDRAFAVPVGAGLGLLKSSLTN